VGVQGAIFLSPNQITASLNAQAFRIPANTAVPELMEVTAGSWRFDYTRLGDASFLTLRAQSPGLELFNQSTVPPSELVFDFAANGHFQASFATFGNTPVIPGMFELGPTAVSALYGSIVKLQVADARNAYVVDGQGRVIYDGDFARIGGSPGQRFFANDVFAGFQGGHRHRHMQRGGHAQIDEIDLGVSQQVVEVAVNLELASEVERVRAVDVAADTGQDAVHR
jgi:hypothetical protein